MKSLFAILALVISFQAQAVDVTITLTAPQATRVAAACGKRLNLGRSCTMVEAKAWTIGLWREVVIDSEREDTNKVLTIEAFEPT